MRVQRATLIELFVVETRTSDHAGEPLRPHISAASSHESLRLSSCSTPSCTHSIWMFRRSGRVALRGLGEVQHGIAQPVSQVSLFLNVGGRSRRGASQQLIFAVPSCSAR